MARDAPIVEASFDELRPGFLAERFAAGAPAARIRCSELLARAWKELMQNPGERMPWDAPLLDIARNHKGGGDISDHLGDVFFFAPRRHAYIARWIELTREPSRNRVAVEPKQFIQGGESFAVSSAAADLSWHICERVMTSLAPAGQMPDFRAIVHRIKYQAQQADNESLFALTADATGTWARLGYWLDERREEAGGPLRRRGLNDLFALASLAPPLRHVLDGVNAGLKRSDSVGGTGAGRQIVSRAHQDSRYFSALAGERKDVATEILVGREWRKLEIDLDHLAIIPGLLAKRDFGLGTTLHRVVNVGRTAQPRQDGSTNTSLLFGAR